MLPTTITRPTTLAGVDYNINDKMKIFARFTIARENAVEDPNEFGGDPAYESRYRPLLCFCHRPQLGHRRNKTNRVILGETVQK